ncbi:MAG: hypothetical protein ABIC82_03205 [bacterium]
MFFNKTFRTTLALIISFELFSFCGYLRPDLNRMFFIGLVLVFLLICLNRMDIGVYILLAELFIGSKGYLFYYDFGGFTLSIRIAFWLIIMGVWGFRAFEYYVRGRRQQLRASTHTVQQIPPTPRRRHSLWRRATLCERGENKKPSPNPSAGGGNIYGRFFKSKLFYYFLAWFAVIGLGLVIGFVRGNSFNNIFDDFNGYLFFGLIFVFYDVIVSREQVNRILGVFAAALVAMSLKTIALLYFFSHSFLETFSIYKWVRTSGVGEITNMGGGYYRIFFQSHIFIIIGFVMFLVFLLFNDYEWGWKSFLRGMFGKFQISNFKFQNKSKIPNSKLQTPNSIYQFSAAAVFLATTILISLSRSFWVGLVGGLVVLFVYYLISEVFSYKKFILYFIAVSAMIVCLFFLYSSKYYLSLFFSVLILFYFAITVLEFPKRKIYIFTSLVVVSFLLGVGLINNVVKFPFPKSSVDVQIGDVLGGRSVALSGDAATSSRWKLLNALKPKIMEFPTFLVGSGFGSTVTYKSSDPRILQSDPTGTYTTYAFEWGYLDVWLKLGIIGLAVYLALILKLLFGGLNFLKKNNWKIESDESRLILGFLLGLIIVCVIHCFTPYLNHPLGIGYILLCVVVFELLIKNKLSELP